MIGVRDIPLVKPLVLERSRSKEVDSRSRPDRTLSGSLVTNSLLSEFTEFRRLSRARRLPTRPPSFTSNGDFGLDSSISGSQQQSNQPNPCLSVCRVLKQPNCFSESRWYLDFFYPLLHRTSVHVTTYYINVVWGLLGWPMISVPFLTSARSIVYLLLLNFLPSKFQTTLK